MPKGTYKQTTNTAPIFGESSPAVLELQKSLNAKGANLELDSKYGPLTKAAFDKYGLVPTPTPSNTSNIVSSSAPVVQDERNTTNTIKGLNVPDPSVESARAASDAYMKLIDDQVKALEERRKSEIEGINKSFDDTKVKTEDAQTREKGTTNVALMRTGGYLGTQISGVGVLNNLAQTHRQEISALEGKRAAAIQAANNAITDKQFALAKEKAQEVKDLDKEINTRRNKFFDQTLSLSQENRLEESSNLKNSLDRVEKMGPTILASIEGMDAGQARDFILNMSKDLGIDANLLLGEVNGLTAKKAEEETKQIYTLASKYPSAGILPTDSFAVAQDKIRSSKEYKLDIARAEADLTNTRSLINQRVKDEAVDYNDPILALYGETTGELVSSPSKARAVQGYADSLLFGKEIVSDSMATKFAGPFKEGTVNALGPNQISETDAKTLLRDAFVKFNKQKDVEVPDSAVWQWLSTPEAQALDDESKKQQIMEMAGKNPEDFGIY